MATVVENYKIAVQVMRPDAAMRYIKIEGLRCYRIVDGDQILADAEPSYLAAWRQAERYLCSEGADIISGIMVRAVCSNKPRPSVQNNHTSNGKQWWVRDVFHARGLDDRTLCAIRCDEWLQIGCLDVCQVIADVNFCKRCASKLIGDRHGDTRPTA